MKRKANYDYSFENVYDPTKINPDLLLAVGHTIFLWNDIERSIDNALTSAIRVPIDLQREVSSRINGIEGKIEIVKACIQNPDRYTDSEAHMLGVTLGALMTYKQARDAVAHARIADEYGGIAPTFERKGDLFEVLVTEESLGILNQHMAAIRLEMVVIVGIITMKPHQRIMRDLSEDAPQQPPFAKEFQQAMDQLPRLQEKRKSLPPLPKLPEAAPAHKYSVRQKRKK